jgi:PBP1b-binding outer membrane lipoprotein LpoB
MISQEANKMKMRNFLVLSILLAGLFVSGCAGPKEEAPIDQASPTTAAAPVSTGDVMDCEISTIESDMVEIEDLLAEMDGIQDISFSELEGLNF